ncbi:MAG: 50S ribosomal protein L6 [Magnetococcales bacterium]|nr:50S ribosomal protein L6 [Magnetococcales bacterium]PPR19721.1 MAG: 50S ribosomal protein L6 [Pseudomonadota bacterium]
MSRIGKNPVTLPDGVEATFAGRDVTIKGPKGSLNWTVPFEIAFEQADKEITFTPKKEDKQSRALWGLSRAMVQNMVTGVKEGYEKSLELRGVGYRAQAQGQKLTMQLGYSHPVEMDVPAGLTATVENNTIVKIAGFDKQLVGQFAADVRAKRKPEPYKGKGVRYVGEYVVMKEGKKK